MGSVCSGTVPDRRKGHNMPISEIDLTKQVADLRDENERLRKQLAETRAQRAEYLEYLVRTPAAGRVAE